MIDVPVLTVLAMLIWVAVLARGAWLVVHPPHQQQQRQVTAA